MDLPFEVGKSPTLKNTRGLVASRNIAKGEVIEECPVVPIPSDQIEDIEATVLNNYYFDWDNTICICLGYGSLINHSFKPNAKYRFRYGKKLMVISAVRNIKRGEEITINYNYYENSKDPLPEYLLSMDKHLNEEE